MWVIKFLSNYLILYINLWFLLQLFVYVFSLFLILVVFLNIIWYILTIRFFVIFKNFFFLRLLIFFLELIIWKKDYEGEIGWFDDIRDELLYWQLVFTGSKRRLFFRFIYYYRYVRYSFFSFFVRNWFFCDDFLLLYFLWFYLKNILKVKIFAKIFWRFWIWIRSTMFVIPQFDGFYRVYAFVDVYFRFFPLGWTISPITHIKKSLLRFFVYMQGSKDMNMPQEKLVFNIFFGLFDFLNYILFDRIFLDFLIRKKEFFLY